MKKYEVIVTPEAEAGIRGAFRYIHDDSPRNASKWLRALYGKISTLERLPGRCGIAREQDYFEEELRQLVFQSHRIVFQIEERQESCECFTSYMENNALSGSRRKARLSCRPAQTNSHGVETRRSLLYFCCLKFGSGSTAHD